MILGQAAVVVFYLGFLIQQLCAQKRVCPKVATYGAECPFDVDNECLSDQECSGSRKCCPSPYDDEACQLLCLEPITQKPGICPPVEDLECPDDIHNFCTQGDDSTCAEELKCCYTGCEYDCLVPDPAPAPSAIKFTVKPPARIRAYVGTNMTLNCSATGDPQPVISWKRQGSQLPVGRGQQIDGSLIIRDVQKEDAGIYVCVATSGGMFDRETRAVVDVWLPEKPGICPPVEDVECPEDIENYCTKGNDGTCAEELKCCYTGCEYDCLVPDPAPAPSAIKFTVKPPARIRAYVGTNMTLNCSATGHPQPVISWKRQGSQLPVGRGQQIDGSLIIRDVQKEDAGIYVCVATSGGMSDRETRAVVDVWLPEKPGICPPVLDLECPDDIHNFCTQGNDSTCAEELKCCYTGCEYDCLVADPALAAPARKLGTQHHGK